MTVDVAGLDGIPTSDVSSVVLNVTADAQNVTTCGACYLETWPDGSGMPAAGSNINYSPGEIIANQVTVMLSPYVNGSGGAIDIYAASGPLDVIVDVEGYYGPSGGSSYVSLNPSRICDTRSGSGDQCAGQTLSANSPLTVTIDVEGGIPSSGVTAVTVNVTALNGSASGFAGLFKSAIAEPNPI